MTVFKTLKLILISLLHVLIKPVNIIHLNLFTLKNSMVLLLNKQVLASGESLFNNTFSFIYSLLFVNLTIRYNSLNTGMHIQIFNRNETKSITL